MENKTFKIILADDSEISGLGLNGNNFTSKNEITPEMFSGKLSHVTIIGDGEGEEGSELVGEHGRMELVQIQKYGSEWWFILRDINPAEIEKLKNRADIDYIAMELGIDLDA